MCLNSVWGRSFFVFYYVPKHKMPCPFLQNTLSPFYYYPPMIFLFTNKYRFSLLAEETFILSINLPLYSSRKVFSSIISSILDKFFSIFICSKIFKAISCLCKFISSFTIFFHIINHYILLFMMKVYNIFPFFKFSLKYIQCVFM